MRRVLFLPIIAALLTAGCAGRRNYQAAEALQPVNPHAALEYIALALADDPADEETRDLLKGVIQAIVAGHQTAVETLVRSGAYAEALAEYDRVIASAALVRSLPGGPYNLYYRENQRSELTEPAAAQVYAAGLRLEREGDLRAAVDAYDRALGLVPNYRDARTRREGLMGRVTFRIFIPPVSPGRDPEAAAILASGVGTAALSSRPRFLQLAAGPARAAVCRIVIESSSFTDSGWQGRRDSARVEVPVYNSKGKQTGTAVRTAHWTVFSRRTCYTLSAGFTVEATDPLAPAPSARASAAETDEAAYAVWHGERSAVPASVLELPSTPADPAGRPALTARAAALVAAELGHRLFLAYK